MLSEVAIVCIAKNESKYIQEWIYYHLKIGISKIIIYDNSDNIELQFLEQTWENKVLIIPWANNNIIKSPFSKNRTFDGPPCCQSCEGAQIWAYENYILNYKKRNLMYKWVAFIDCDEFIKINNNSMDIVPFFNSINFNEGILTLNWVHYGSNGHNKYENKPLIERFTKRESNGTNLHKSICVIENTISVNHSMHDFKTTKYTRNANGDNIQHGLKSSPCIDKISIAHFAVKSKEEFREKIDRKYAIIQNFGTRNWDHFNEFDRNEIEDLTLLNTLKSKKNTYNGLDTDSYLWDHPDLFQNGCISPSSLFWHWENHGKKEGRLTNLNFDYNKYKNKYSDLKNLTDPELINHYYNNGIKEGRTLN